jgi:penicillin-binding protein 1B
MPKKRRRRRTRKKYSTRRFKLAVVTLGTLSVLVFLVAASVVHHTLRFTALIDSRLRGESVEHAAWVHSRDYELRRGQRLSSDDLVATLNALGYRELPDVTSAGGEGTYSRNRADEVQFRRRGAFRVPVSVRFERLWVAEVTELRGNTSIDRVVLEPVPVTTLFGSDRAKKRWVPLDEIPDHVISAVVATEDRRFFSHTGFDPLGIARALWVDIRSGELRQGGSTITQQLVKNYFLAPERTLRRKLLEAYLAVLLETRVTKEDILELYLNDVYLGQRGSFGIRGVGQAASVFFGKDLRNVDVADAALIAAIIRSPNATSPYRYPALARDRRNIVIDQMVESSLLSESEARVARARPLGLARATIDSGEAPYFIDALRFELSKGLGIEHLADSGIEIRSTMDRYLQTQAQNAVVEGLEEIRSKHSPPKETPQAALVALDPRTGDVLALVGGASYRTSQFNRALDARRQPGSAFKPFVFAAAFEHDPGLSPASGVVDEPTVFRMSGGRSWSPQNYSRRFEGRVSYRRALALSLNVATARVGQAAGFEKVVRLWDSMQLSTELEPYPSLVLGAFEVTPLDLAVAYSALANGGIRIEPRLFESVHDESGRTLLERPVHGRRVLSEESAYLVTSMMQSVVSFGTAKGVRARGFLAEAAGKTGTTNDTRDAWFVGYTPDVLAVVWVGYDDNRPLQLAGSDAALPIWTRFMKAAVSGREKERFRPPSGIVFRDIDPTTGMAAAEACPSREREAFRSSSVPRALCERHAH